MPILGRPEKRHPRAASDALPARRRHTQGVSDPVFDIPQELEPPRGAPGGRTLALLRDRDFRALYAAVATSELGSALHYIALMWFASMRAGRSGSSR